VSERVVTVPASERGTEARSPYRVSVTTTTADDTGTLADQALLAGAPPVSVGTLGESRVVRAS
jgi:hypothetical protein